MAKERVIRQMTEEQRDQIRNSPGVLVRRRDPDERRSRFEPKISVKEPISVRELLGRDDDLEGDED
jgi:hypothetical protein